MASGEYLNIREAASYLGVSDVKIRRLVIKGLLRVSLDPLDARKRLAKKRDLATLTTPRPAAGARARIARSRRSARRQRAATCCPNLARVSAA